MEKFIVSARKYRPQNFNTVVGQQHITTTLKNAILNNHLAHAFLFCGPRGVGKTTCARILAKTINCENRTPDGEACNTCNSCISFDNGSSFNIHELDAASNNSVDDIRNLVEQVRFAPQAGAYKVYIVDEVHMLSASAFNAFLKTLEEPPPYAIFILATTEKHKILPTILSRCQIFDFKRITINDTVDHLREICEKEEIQADKASLHLIAQKSEGCMRDSLSILDKIASFTDGKITYSNTLEHLNVLDEDYYFKLLDYMQHQQLTDALLLFDDINQKGFEGDTLLEGMAEFVRNLMVSKDAKAAILLEVADDFRSRYIQSALIIDAGWMIAALNILSEAASAYKQARNKRLFVELILIKLIYLSQAVEMLSEGGAGKKKIAAKSKAIAFKNISPVKLKEIHTDIKSIASASNEEKVEAVIKAEKPIISGIPTAAKKTEPEISKLGSMKSLERIRAGISAKNGNSVAQIPLSDIELDLAWNKFIVYLVSLKNHSAATVFKNTKRIIISENNLNIITGSVLEQKFIEAERSRLIHHLQEYFNNRLLVYQLMVEETASEQVPGEKTLSTREQFNQMADKYPLLKELKDRLRLELDY
ncbi:MAG: DNA polymerase III subunit gamma/tau [Ferruginibacter sp.]